MYIDGRSEPSIWLSITSKQFKTAYRQIHVEQIYSNCMTVSFSKTGVFIFFCKNRRLFNWKKWSHTSKSSSTIQIPDRMYLLVLSRTLTVACRHLHYTNFNESTYKEENYFLPPCDSTFSISWRLYFLKRWGHTILDNNSQGIWFAIVCYYCTRCCQYTVSIQP